jgi:uncharacterized protein YggE
MTFNFSFSLPRSNTRLLTALILSAGLVAPAAAFAQAPPPPPGHPAPAGGPMHPGQPAPTLRVTGEGRAAVAPDMAMLTLAVTRMADTADAALAANNTALRDVLAALKEDGIAERDVQTSEFSIFPRYSQPDPNRQGNTEAPKIEGYQVTNGLTVRVRDLQKLGAILDRSVKLGVNQGGQISFTNADTAKVTDEARRNAVADAMAKAKTLADAAGVPLGAIVSIEENSQRPEPMPMMRMAMAKEADGVPVAGGENTYTVAVEMRFEIGR